MNYSEIVKEMSSLLKSVEAHYIGRINATTHVLPYEDREGEVFERFREILPTFLKVLQDHNGRGREE